MDKTVRDTIKSITRSHLTEKGGLCLGQCLTAVGWVGGTLPELYEEDGMVEVTTADVANGGFAVGAALAGRRPIYVVRYQGFQWYNAPMIINYACKSKEIWGIPCPLIVRSVAMEGGMGPVAGSSHHALYYRMPGTNIVSPMTPREYEQAYQWFMEHDEVLYISEHRGSYNNTEELNDVILEESDITLFPISISRFAAEEARKILEESGIKTSIIHQVWLKPYIIADSWRSCLNNSKYGGIVIDDDYPDGIARSVAHKLMNGTTKFVDVLGLEDKTAGFHPDADNLPPSATKIVKKVMSLIND